MDQQQEQKKSGSSILNDIQAAQSGLKIGRFLISQGAKLLSGIGGPVLLTIGLIFLGVFVVGFAGIPGGSGGTTPQPSQPPISITPPPGGLRQSIMDRFGIIMNGFDNQQLQWAWEKFLSVSGTRFNGLVKGVTIIADNDSRQVDNNTIYLKKLTQQDLFNVVLTHELGHIIRWRTDSYIAELRQAISQEGYVTSYSANAPSCTGSDKFNEDYAEMIAYYLNPASPSQTASRCSSGSNPYINNGFRLHYNIARQILGTF